MPPPAEKSVKPNGNHDRTLLELLTDSSADELEAELARRQEEHRKRGDRSADAFAEARVRELMAYRRRRELEIYSLYSTARSLASLGEVDQVLKTIVHHAHELMATDFTYLSVYEDDGTLSLRASEGTISAAFQAARTPVGVGVAEHVRRTRRPYWVRDYLAAGDIAHDPEFDRMTQAEGMLAVLGVPLISRDRVFGVLYAADRTPRAFQDDEIALLSAYGDHAAVALENARLYEQARSAVEELTAAQGAIEDDLQTIVHAASIQESLTAAVLAGGGVQALADRLVDALGGEIVILDSDQRILAAGPKQENGPSIGGRRPGEGEVPLPEWLPAIEASHTTRRHATIPSPDGETRTAVAAVLAGETYLGALVLTRPEPLHPQDPRIVERAAQILGLARLQEDSLVDAEERVRRELLIEILTSPNPFPRELIARAGARHIKLDALKTIIVAAVPGDRAMTATRQLQQLARQQGGLAANHLGLLTMLVPSPDADGEARRVHQHLKRALAVPITVCASSIAAPPDSPGRQFVLARRCSQLMQALGQADAASTTHALGLYAVVFDPDRGDDLQAILAATDELARYDEKRGADLLRTLNAYFTHHGNLTKTARAMDVHVNTLLKRLERVSEVLGQDWQHDEATLRLQFSVKLRLLARMLGAAHA